MLYEGRHASAPIKIHKRGHDGFALGARLRESHSFLKLRVRNIYCCFHDSIIDDIGIQIHSMCKVDPCGSRSSRVVKQATDLAAARIGRQVSRQLGIAGSAERRPCLKTPRVSALVSSSVDSTGARPPNGLTKSGDAVASSQMEGYRFFKRRLRRRLERTPLN
jgi:hypothetical protein